MKEINVIGTMQLLAACQKAPSVRKLVVKSSTAVYGSSPRDPALFTEDIEPQRAGRGPATPRTRSRSRATCAASPGAAPTSRVTVLRFANFIGPTVRHRADVATSRCRSCRRCSASTRGCSSCTSDDGLEVLRRATLGDHPRHVQRRRRRRAAAVAGDPPRRPPVAAGAPRRPARGSARRCAGWACRLPPEQIRFLTYGRVVDTSRLQRRARLRPRATRPARRSTTS